MKIALFIIVALSLSLRGLSQHEHQTPSKDTTKAKGQARDTTVVQ
jgi:hypothetical protein